MTDIGLCHYCNKSVFASEGQAIKYIRFKTMGRTFEKPTHKKCRKLIKKH